MKRVALLAVMLTFGLSLWADFADAKRMGGGRSLGMQRSAPVQKAAPTTTPATAPQQAAKPAAQPATQTPAQPAPQASGASRWLGPIAGLAAGLGLAALASHFGFGEQLANGLMIALLVMVGIVVFGWVIRRVLASPRLATQGALAEGTAQRTRMEVARETWQPVGSPASGSTANASAPASSADAGAPSTSAGHHDATEAATQDAPHFVLPAGFDADGFVRQAKVNFIRLQAANDEGNLADLREFTTPEVYAELKLDIDARKGAAQKTEVIDLEAAIVDYAEEADRWVVSVRYSGRLYEDAGVASTPLDEVWHLAKPRDDKSGWLVAGIQQVS
jgi:predicted lipid-binding transport protein (Tim44 family)